MGKRPFPPTIHTRKIRRGNGRLRFRIGDGEWGDGERPFPPTIYTREIGRGETAV
jgi:hypothetical protein